MKSVPAQPEYHPLLYRVAVLLVLIVFPLIWVGGLVTTYDAGMAVPDWPNTYGYNMFLYPIYDWFFGPWDLFVEHGHRLLASLAGLITIVVVIVAWRSDSRKWFLYLTLWALGFVILQGILGGVRVVMDQRQIAKIHGCVGPLYFVSVVAIVVCSSRWWFDVRTKLGEVRHSVAGDSLSIVSLIMLLVSLSQLIVGASMRHIAVGTDPTIFRSLVVTHLSLAAIILVGSVSVAFLCFRQEARGIGLRLLGLGLVVCVLAQIGLGMGSWIIKFGWPIWFSQFGFASGFVVGEKSFLQMNIITGHVAVGSLILALLTIVTLRSYRLAECSLMAGRRKVETKEIELRAVV